MGYPSLTPAYAGLLKRKGSGLRLLKSTFNGENFTCKYCLGQSPAIGAQFTFETCVAAQNRKIIIKTSIWSVQSHLRSSMLTFLRSLSPVLVMNMISSMSVPICNHFHGRGANSGKITSFYGGCFSFASSFVRTP